MPKPQDHDERDFVSTFDPSPPESLAEELAQLFEGTSDQVEVVEETRLTSIRVRATVLAQIDAYARKVDRSRSWVMDRLLMLALQEVQRAMTPQGLDQFNGMWVERARELDGEPESKPRRAA